MRTGWLACVLLALTVAACDPIQGSGTGTQPDVSQFIHIDDGSRSVVVTFVAGYPATDIQFNYNGYGDGSLVLTVPVGWLVTIQCENHGTVPNSCAVVPSREATAPVDPTWSTPEPQRGLPPGESASFAFTPEHSGTYRIASLVSGSEASGMWAVLQIVATGRPTLVGSG